MCFQGRVGQNYRNVFLIMCGIDAEGVSPSPQIVGGLNLLWANPVEFLEEAK